MFKSKFKLWIILILPFTPLTGCLDNLNQTEFFRKLKIKSPELYTLVSRHRVGIEKKIREACQTRYGSKIQKITYWGEGRYWAGHVIKKHNGKDHVIQSGVVWLRGAKTKKVGYTLLFDVSQTGEISIIKFWK